MLAGTRRRKPRSQRQIRADLATNGRKWSMSCPTWSSSQRIGHYRPKFWTTSLEIVRNRPKFGRQRRSESPQNWPRSPQICRNRPRWVEIAQFWSSSPVKAVRNRATLVQFATNFGRVRHDFVELRPKLVGIAQDWSKSTKAGQSWRSSGLHLTDEFKVSLVAESLLKF